MKKANLKIIKALIELNGEEEAKSKIIEESLELALSIVQYRCPTKTNKVKRLDDIHKELADMKIVLRKAEMLFNKRKINKYVNTKLQKKKAKYLTK